MDFLVTEGQLGTTARHFLFQWPFNLFWLHSRVISFYLKQYLIAIDIGTTSAKSFSISPEGEILSSLQRFYPTTFSSAGFAEQDPDLIFKSVVDLIRSSVTASEQCVGVSFSAAMHSIMAINELGQPILPLLIWSDTRSRQQSGKIKDSG